MGRFVLRRLVQGLVSLVFLSVIIFGLSRLSGNPLHILMSEYATPEDYARMAAVLGLDKPLAQQYLIFAGSVLKGDLGTSILARIPVTELLGSRIVNTFELAGVAIVLSLLIALPLGVVAAVKKDSLVDYVARVVALIGQSVPPFWMGLVLIMIFSVRFGVFPAGGRGTPMHMVLPAITLGWLVSAGILRLLRSGMIEALESDYIVLARMKGLREGVVVWKHALRNALLPVVTYAGVVFVHLLLVGSIVVETVFGWPGLGRLTFEAALTRDYPVIQGITLLAGVLFVTSSIVVDVLYAFLDPRIRYQ